MLHKFTILLTSFLLILLSSCSNQPTEDMQGTLYTQSNMWTEKNKVIGTNYARGGLIAVNTAVEIVEFTDEIITFKIQNSGHEIELINVPKYTHSDIQHLFKRYFKNRKVNLSQLSSNTLDAIADGKIIKGMTKNEVIVSRGHPPAHATMSLKQNTWKYWKNRVSTQRVIFKNGVVKQLN